MLFQVSRLSEGISLSPQMWSQLTRAQTATQTALVINHDILPDAFVFWEGDEPRILVSSFSSLETSGPAHHRLILTSFLLHCVLMTNYSAYNILSDRPRCHSSLLADLNHAHIWPGVLDDACKYSKASGTAPAIHLAWHDKSAASDEGLESSWCRWLGSNNAKQPNTPHSWCLVFFCRGVNYDKEHMDTSHGILQLTLAPVHSN